MEGRDDYFLLWDTSAKTRAEYETSFRSKSRIDMERINVFLIIVGNSCFWSVETPQAITFLPISQKVKKRSMDRSF